MGFRNIFFYQVSKFATLIELNAWFCGDIYIILVYKINIWLQKDVQVWDNFYRSYVVL